MKKVKLVTLGCKVNQYETQAIREQLLRAGVRENNGARADIYIINTCTVTAQADRKSRHLIRQALRSNPQGKIIVTGCYVEKDAPEVLDISDKIQIVPNSQKHLLLKSLLQTFSFTGNGRYTERFIPLKISGFRGHQRAFVKIQDGCNNFCSYCKVPLVRGRSRSRSLKEIIVEVERLTERGFKEIVLTGICLGDYHYRDFDLVDVLASLEKINRRFRIRLSSIEPQLISDRLIESFNFTKVCPHLHIPLQSGDDLILKKMNRGYTRREYLALIAKIKKKVQDVAITTDVLVGIPGEKERNFYNNLRCLKEILPLRTHIFPFSPRRGTAAFDLQPRIEPKLIKKRINLLKKAAQESSYKFRKTFLGKHLRVLIESKTRRENGSFCGYADNYIRVIVDNVTKKNVNELLQVKIETVEMPYTRGHYLPL